MHPTSSAPDRKVRGSEPARLDRARAAVFINSTFNNDLCDIQQAVMDLGLAVEEFLAADHVAKLSADLAAAGFDPAPTYKESVDLHTAEQSLKMIAATMRLTYETLGRVVNQDLVVVEDATR